MSESVSPATNAVMHITEKQFQLIINELFQRAHNRVLSHFTDEINEGDTLHVPTASAVYKALHNNNNKYIIIEGEMPDENDLDTDYIYLQHVSPESESYITHIYVGDKWLISGYMPTTIEDNHLMDILDYCTGNLSGDINIPSKDDNEAIKLIADQVVEKLGDIFVKQEDFKSMDSIDISGIIDLASK